MGYWIIPGVITILLAMFTTYILSEAGTEEVGLAGPFFLVASTILFLVSWLIYFIIF